MGTIPYELAVKEDLNTGYGTVSVTNPAGGSHTGNKIGIHSFLPQILSAADQAGGDEGAKIAAAITALGSSIGIVDCRGFGATGTISATITIPANVTVILGPTVFTCTAGAFILNSNGAKLLGTGTGTQQAAAGGQTVLRASGFSNTTDMIVVQGAAGATLNNIEVGNIKVDFNNAAGAGRYGLFIENAQDCFFHDLNIYNPGTDGVRIQPSGAAAAAYRNLLVDVHVLGFAGSGLRLQATGEISHNTFINCELDAAGVITGSHAVYLSVPALSAAAQSINQNMFINLHALVGAVGANSFNAEQVSGSGQIKDLTLLGASLERNGGSGGTGFNISTSAAANILNIKLDPVSFATVTTSHNISSATCTGFYVAESGALRQISTLHFGDRSTNENELTFGGTGNPVFGIYTDGAGDLVVRRKDTDTHIVRFDSTFGLWPDADNTFNSGRSNFRWATVYGVNGQFDGNVKVGGGTAITSIVSLTLNLTPASVNPNTTAEQSFTATGLAATDTVMVSPPTTPVAGTGIVAARGGSNAVIITFCNVTGGALTPSAGNYLVTAVRH